MAVSYTHLLIAILLKYRKFGRKLYAIGGSQQSALMMGLDVRKTKFKAYVLDGFLAGLGGFLFCLNTCAGFVEQAKGLEMDAISAAVIGGTLLSGGVGTPIGTMFGVLIKGTISSLITEMCIRDRVEGFVRDYFYAIGKEPMESLVF